jgi:hypothetical protein
MAPQRSPGPLASSSNTTPRAKLRRDSARTWKIWAVFNMATQFGGGKTHTLTLLYHLATHGPRASAWPGVAHILAQAGIKEVPEAATAVFVGTEFDSIQGRGGDDGTPKRSAGREKSCCHVTPSRRATTTPTG